MTPVTLSDALLAHSVPALGTEAAIMRVNWIKDADALDVAESKEIKLNGRSAVLDAIHKRRTVLREKTVRAEARRKGGVK